MTLATSKADEPRLFEAQFIADFSPAPFVPRE